MNVSNIFRQGVVISRPARSFIFQRFLKTTAATMVKVGDPVPSIDLYEDHLNKVNLAELGASKKVVVFAVPGAFTPGCSKTHLPGYVKKAEELKQQGVSDIICVSVNDPFVMAAWAQSQNTSGKVRLLADPSAALAKALDLTVDIPLLGGVRSKRYSMVIENGKIASLQVEPDGTGLLYDTNRKVCSVAEDLSHIDTRTRVNSFSGFSVLRHAIADAHIVISVGGCKRGLKETSRDLFERNMDDIRITALHMIEFNPTAIFCIAKPPIEALVPLVSEEYKKGGVYDFRKIIGITSIGSMRANHFIAAKTGLNALDVLCPIIGGLSSDCLVSVLSQARPFQLHPKDFRAVQNAVTGAEDNVLNLYAGCAEVCLSPALAISRFISSLIKALKGNSSCVDCAYVKQMGHIALPTIQELITLGESIATGEKKSVNALAQNVKEKEKDSREVAHQHA
ncbi:hypothetical protein NQ317_003349 [Molorchus minor]|uniref:Peroxiredoxin-5, mitochondrial n=1 Tax=Molorchus minor TaxID=1323400 RepID=A0ABQ9K608_9CUCU|nr:hypothetical protein NQ317_003349 [Molorchus minor]